MSAGPLSALKTLSRSCRGGRRALWKVPDWQPAPTSIWRGMYTEQQNQGDQKQEETFDQIFRNSRFVRMGNPVGKRVEGEVVAVVDQNMYVDFGYKFHAVVPLPQSRVSENCKGKRVIITINDLEMTDHFLGNSKHISLLEADATFEQFV